MHVGELTLKHLGETITITTGDASVTGLLAGIHHECQLISDPYIGDPTERFVVGPTASTITISGWGPRTFSPHHECTVAVG